MNRKFIELALKKQRLQLKIAGQRVRVLHALGTAGPAFGATERIRAGWRWAKAHPEWLAAVGAVLLVVRPRAAWHWAKRSLFAWRVLRRLRGAVASILPSVER